MLAFLLLFCLLNLATAGSTTSCSSPTPIVLPITNVKLSNDQDVRGIPLSIGTPAQNFSFQPSDFFNDTWVFNSSAAFCWDNTTETQCLSQRGGLYDPKKSKTARGGLNVFEAGGDSTDTEGRVDGPHVWFNKFAQDTLLVGNVSLNDYPIGMAGLDYGEYLNPQANIGLGRNSTLLNALKDAGHISSRVWGYWPGIDSATPSAAMDGSIVFGGYDAAKTMGANLTQPLAQPSRGCPSGMSLILTSMRLDFPNGTEADLLAPQTISACFRVNFPAVMTAASNPYYNRFLEYSDITPIDWMKPLYSPREVFTGELTLAFSSGFSVTISNDVLVVPEYQVGPDGALETNSSASVVKIGVLVDEDANDNPTIGRDFFSSAYLMVDLEAQTFTLWQANATTDTSLVTVGGDCPAQPSSVTAITNNANTATTSGAISNETASAAPKPGITTTTIVGVVIGAALGVGALIAASILFIWRRRKIAKSSQSTTELTARELSIQDDTSSGTPSYVWRTNELGSHEIVEMSAAQWRAHELGGYHKPHELHCPRTPKYELDAS